MGVELSVIVATCNRCALLQRLLESLYRQTLSPERYEVIVVSDGSTDATASLVKTWQGKHPNLVLLEQTNRGPAAARNNGGRAARGKYLAFTDDDCVPACDWLEKLIEAFERTGAAGIQGRTSTDESKCSPLTNEVRNEHGMSGVPTCNAGYRKSAFEKVGGFDESFVFPHNEDADFAWRVERLGEIPFVRAVHVLHPPRLETLQKRAYWVRYLESEFLLFAKHPETYRRRCASSPWYTIYWYAFILSQFGSLKGSMKYLVRPFRPSYCVQGLGLMFLRGWNLLRFFPFYLRAARRYSPAESKEVVTTSPPGTVDGSRPAPGETSVGH